MPIPGTKRVPYIDENLGSLQLRLSPGELRLIGAILGSGITSGNRSPPQPMRSIDLQWSKMGRDHIEDTARNFDYFVECKLALGISITKENS